MLLGLRPVVPAAPAAKRPRLLSGPQFRKGTPVLRPASSALRRQRVQLRISAELTDKGRRFRASEVEVKRIMGEGSYGQVFEGVLNTARGAERVVLKRVKARIKEAEQMGQMEHLLNVYATKAARGAIADFVGYLEVDESEATTRLTPGLWLIWQYDGAQTLGSYLRKRDCIPALAADLGVSEAAVVPTVMKQIFESLQALHSAGLVHRDVKPANIIFSESQRRFMLIDLGACADLRSGTNFIPDESILDPMYCPPEQYCLPTDAPHLAKQSRAVAAALSPMVWAQHKPDRFDSFSAGLVLMQLALSKLRTSNTLRSFSEQMVECNHDLELWRERHAPGRRETVILDANNGQGWELARTLLRPRLVVADKRTGAVAFVRGGAQRISVRAALQHRFTKQADKQAGSGAFGTWLGRLTGTMDSEDEGTGTGTRWGTGTGSTTTGGSGSITQVAASVAASRQGVGSGYISAGSVRREQAYKNRAGTTGSASQGHGTGSVAASDDEGAARPKRRGIGAALFAALSFPRRRKVVARPTTKQAPKSTGAAAALQPASPGQQSPSGSTSVKAMEGLGRAAGIWSRASGKLFNLEAKIKDQASVTERQTSVVKVLEARVAAGQADASELATEQSTLAAMTQQLTDMTVEFRTLYRGVLGGITGRKKKASTRTQPKKNVVRRLPAGQAAPATTSGAADDAVELTSPALPDGVGESNVTAAANKAVAAGLRFTGQALGIATGMVASIEGQAEAARERARVQSERARAVGAADASRILESAPRSTSRRQPPVAVQRGGTTPANADADLRVLSRAYMEMLRDLSPPLTSNSRWSATRERIRKDPRYTAIQSSQREKLFNTYMQAVRSLEQQQRDRAARARQGFQELLSEAGITATSTWETTRPLLELNPTFANLPEDERKVAFEAAVAEKRRQATAASTGDTRFRQLLVELQPPVTPESTWRSVKRAAWVDSRYDSVTEERRQQLFEEFRSMLAEEVAAADMQHSQASSGSGGGTALDRATLAEERQRVAAQLAELEAKLQAQDGESVNSTNGIPADAP